MVGIDKGEIKRWEQNKNKKSKEKKTFHGIGTQIYIQIFIYEPRYLCVVSFLFCFIHQQHGFFFCLKKYFDDLFSSRGYSADLALLLLFNPQYIAQLLLPREQYIIESISASLQHFIVLIYIFDSKSILAHLLEIQNSIEAILACT